MPVAALRLAGRPVARRLARLATSKTGAILAALCLAYAAAGFLLVPWLLQRELPGLIERHYGARASLAEARFNPLRLEAELRELHIGEAGGRPAIEVGLVRVNFELGSLWRRAWTFSDIRIERPRIHADLDASGELNLVRLFTPRHSAGTDAVTAPAAAPPRLLIGRLSLSAGALMFTDHTLQPAATARSEPIDFEILDVATLPDHRGDYRLKARLPGGGRLDWTGQLALAPLQSSARFTLSDGKFAIAWNFLRDHLAIAEPAGRYSLSLQYRIGYSGGRLALSVSALDCSIQDLVIAKPGSHEPLLRLGTLALEDGHFELETRSLGFRNVRLADAALSVSVDGEGVADWSRLMQSGTAADRPAAAVTPSDVSAAPVKPWQVQLPQIAIGPLSLAFTDMSRATPLRATLASLEASLGLNLAFGGTPQVTLQNLAAKAAGIALQPLSAAEPLITLQAAGVEGVFFDLQQQSLAVASARIGGGQTRMVRDSEGRMALAGMFAARQPTPARPSTLRMAVERFELSGHSLAFADQSWQPTLAYDLEQISARLDRFSWPARGDATLDLGAVVKQGGSLKARGRLDPGRETADLRLEVAALSLTPLDALLKRDTTLTLAAGRLSAAGRLQWDGRKSPTALRYTGKAAVDALDMRVAADRQRLFSFRQLAATGLDADLGGKRIAIAHIDLSEPHARLLINKDKTTNLAAIRRPPAPAATPAPVTPPPAVTVPATPVGAPAAAPSPLRSAPEAAMAVSVDRISIEGGTLDFSDQSLVLPYATLIRNLKGSASGLSTAAPSRASLRFEGTVAEFGLARGEGTIQPFAPKAFTDIALAFRNVDLPPMTPYSATFAGRRIDSGRLSLDLRYQINDGKLAGNNQLLLEKFTLGERVESPTAVSLPLDLAIALLTDSEGRIDLAVPVSGDIDNPEFSYGHLVWQAIRTVLSRVVSSPFRALASLFGGNAESLSDIVFDAGSTRVLPTETEKLRWVAEGLEKRPRLQLQVQGTWHPDVDARALRAAAVRADLAAREGTRLAPGEDPGPVGFDSAKTQRALEQMLEARAGDNAVASFVEGYRKSSGRAAPRVNAALALVGRGSGDRELYVTLHQRLIELQPLAPAALADLARARAAAIVDAMAKTAKLDAVRMTIKPAEAVDEAVKNGVPAKLSFAVLK